LVGTRAWTTVTDSTAVRRTHTFDSVVISRGPTIGCIGACAGYVLRAGGRRADTRARGRRTAERQRGEGDVVRGWRRVEGEERTRAGEGGVGWLVGFPRRAPSDPAPSGAERLLRGGIILSLSILSALWSLSVSILHPRSASVSFGLTPAPRQRGRLGVARRKATRGASCETRAISHGAFYYY